MNWYIKVLKNYSGFSGRARRKEYWMFFLFNIIISFGIGFVLGFIGAILGNGPTLTNFVILIYSLALLLPAIAVAVRRMHDTGRSGWWIIVPFINLIFLCLDGEPHENKYGPDPKSI